MKKIVAICLRKYIIFLGLSGTLGGWVGMGWVVGRLG